MNSSDFWKLGDEYVVKQVNALDLSLHVDGLPHFLCPVILFIDSALVDCIGLLKIEPVLCSIGNICGSKRSATSSWFILGFISTNPKSSQELQADGKSQGRKHAHSYYYHSCVKSIVVQDLLSVDQNVSGHKMCLHGHGYMHLHFKLPHYWQY